MYHSSLFSCFDDFGICLYGWLCPYCLNANNLAKIRNEDCSFSHCALSIFPILTRQLIRNQNNLPSNLCGDCLITCFCEPCSICQDARELKYLYRSQN